MLRNWIAKHKIKIALFLWVIHPKKKVVVNPDHKEYKFYTNNPIVLRFVRWISRM